MSPAPGDEVLRAVLDSNIYISAFHSPNGRNAVLWQAAIDELFQLIVSPPIIRETARVLRADFQWPEERVLDMVRLVARVAGRGLVTPRGTLDAVKDDPDDNRILECAVDGRAELIISNDRHLLDLKQYAGIPIVGSVDFRRTLGLK